VTLEELNALSPSESCATLERCCGASRWIAAMSARRPFPNAPEMLGAATEIWRGLNEADWLEAFEHHPRIGDVDALRQKFASTRMWAAGEQAGAAEANEAVLRDLAEGNRTYEARFGYIFIVCATGKRADEMLKILRQRLPNDPVVEIRIAAGEQDKITRLRLEKLLSS
jgi:2-oxo-4-hydroxy-4-carboxy-5-ureidoimidazoline decarboxylase